MSIWQLRKARQKDTPYQITEGIAGMWHYHISDIQSPSKSLCGKDVMCTSYSLEQWKSFEADHVPHSWCDECNKIYSRLTSKDEGEGRKAE